MSRVEWMPADLVVLALPVHGLTAFSMDDDLI